MSCANIRKWMGNFKDIRNPAKYAARLGQCFSATRAMRNRQITVDIIADVAKTCTLDLETNSLLIYLFPSAG